MRRARVWSWGLAAALAGLLAAAPALGQSKTGTTIGQFLLIEPSARITGMGNAGVSLAAGLDAAYYNPAAIASLERTTLSFSHSAWIADIAYDYAAAAFPLGHWGNAWASVTSLNSGEMDVRTVNSPLGTGERFTVSDVAIGFGYGRSITDRFSAGFQVGYVQERIWHSSANTLVLGFGTLFQVSENGLHIGSSLSNFGTQAGYSGRELRFLYDQDPSVYGDNSALPGERLTDDFPVPVLFRVGVGMPFRPNPATVIQVALDAFHPADNSESVSGGVEVELRDLVAARVGYQNLFLEDSEVGLTAGAGVKGEVSDSDFRVDYAWADHGRLGGTHRFTLAWVF